MKIRNGFVSNSSSSSFIIAFKKNANKCPTCGHMTVDIATYLTSRNGDDDNSIYSLGCQEVIDDVNSNFIDNIKYSRVSEAKQLVDERDSILEKIEKFQKQGYDFAHIGISYHDTWLNEEFGRLCSTGEIQVIQDNN
jgi:hypothetical protein